ncbi:MAG: ArnT family glycosyltransferase [Alloprevotella sp.]
MRKRREQYLIYIGVTLAFLPILLLRDFTPANELRYLSIADEALRNHTFFAFTNHGVPYADKPPLYFWAVMLCRWIAGEHHMWLLSLLSLLPAWGIVHTMNRWTHGETDSDSRVLAQWMLLTCGLFAGAAVTLRMDMLMCLFIVLSLRAFWQIQTREGRYERSRWLFPLYLFLALFTKGPLGLLVPLCGTAVFLGMHRRWADFFRCWGVLTWGVLTACCALWFWAVYAEGGADYLHNLLFRQTAGRAVNSFHHAEPFYYYAVSILYSLAPWSLLLLGTVAAALRAGVVRSELQRFFLTVGVTTFVLLSCISSKLQVYLLPAVPFLVYATAMFLPRFRWNRWIGMSLALPSVMFSLSLPLLLIAAALRVLSVPAGVVYVAAALLTLGGIRSLYLIYKAAGVARTVRQLASSLLFSLFVAAWGLPQINAGIGYGSLCRKAGEISAARGIREIRTWHIPRAENMDVYLHRPVTVLANDSLPSPSDRPYLLLTRRSLLDHFAGAEVHEAGQYAVVEMSERGKRQHVPARE